jgi:hypothetical protein
MMKDEIYKENDNIYVNISFYPTIQNNLQSSIIPLNYTVNKTIPILDNCSEYYATIVKFDMPLQSIPVTIFPVIPNQSNPNLSPIIVGILNSGTQYLQNVIYTSPWEITIFPPPIQNQPTQVVTPYYYVFSYDLMIKMINNALAIAYTNSGLGGTAPYFIYDASTQLISLIVSSLFNSAIGPQVIVSNRIFQYIDQIATTLLEVTPTFNNLYTYNVYGLVNESYGYAQYAIAPMNPPAFYKITQGATTVMNWNPLRKILFLTNLIPIHYEQTPSTNIILENSGVSNSIPLMIDFTPNVEKAQDNRSIAYYNPGGYGSYRLVDMTTNTPLYKIDVKVYWQDINNNIIPFIIPSYQQANIKLGFIRKSLYKHF